MHSVSGEAVNSVQYIFRIRYVKNIGVEKNQVMEDKILLIMLGISQNCFNDFQDISACSVSICPNTCPVCFASETLRDAL